MHGRAGGHPTRGRTRLGQGARHCAGVDLLVGMPARNQRLDDSSLSPCWALESPTMIVSSLQLEYEVGMIQIYRYRTVQLNELASEGLPVPVEQY